MKSKLAEFIDDGMPGISAALISDDDIVVFGKEIDHSSLSLIAPVDAYYCAVRHKYNLRVFTLPYYYTPFNENNQ